MPGEQRDDSAPPVPAVIEGEVIALVQRHLYAVGRDPMVISETTEGVGSTTYIGGADRFTSGRVKSPASTDAGDSDDGGSDAGEDGN